MTTTEDRLRRALAARADLVDEVRLTPTLADRGEQRSRRRTAAVVGAAAAAVAVIGAALIAVRGGDGSPDPAPPVPEPTGTQRSEGPAPIETVEARGDVDGDGVEDVVRLGDGRLEAELSSSGDTATRRVDRRVELTGLADVGTDRQFVDRKSVV